MIKLEKKFEIDYAGLETYLKSLTASDFRGPDGRRGTNESGKIRKGTSISDVVYFKKDTTKIMFSDVIAYGQPFLLDLLGNDLSIAVLTKKRYKTPKGRSVKVRFVRTIIENCREQYGTPLNGYWIIPNDFITYV